jgi:hypothetical protein
MQQHFPTAAIIAEPAEVYRDKRRVYLTSHQLIDCAACPLRYRQKAIGLITEGAQEYYAIGAATHTLTLEGPEAFRAQYCVGGPINPKTERPYGADTKAFAQWAREQGKPALSDEQFSLVSCLAAAVRSHDVARELLRQGIPEGVARAEWQGVACQIRIDWFSPIDGIADLKTCENLDSFAPTICQPAAQYPADAMQYRAELSPTADIAKYCYREQMAFYRSIYRAATGYTVPVYLIAVEKREPYRCGVWQLSEVELDKAEARNVAAIERYKEYKAANSWPTGFEELRML